MIPYWFNVENNPEASESEFWPFPPRAFPPKMVANVVC